MRNLIIAVAVVGLSACSVSTETSSSYRCMTKDGVELGAEALSLSQQAELRERFATETAHGECVFTGIRETKSFGVGF